MLVDLDLPAQVTLAVSVVAALRARFPRMDGWYAVLAVAVVSLATAVATEPALAPTSLARHAVLVFLYALGGMSAAQHLARSVGKSLGGSKGSSDGEPR